MPITLYSITAKNGTKFHLLKSRNHQNKVGDEKKKFRIFKEKD